MADYCKIKQIFIILLMLLALKESTGDLKDILPDCKTIICSYNDLSCPEDSHQITINPTSLSSASSLPILTNTDDNTDFIIEPITITNNHDRTVESPDSEQKQQVTTSDTIQKSKRSLSPYQQRHETIKIVPGGYMNRKKRDQSEDAGKTTILNETDELLLKCCPQTKCICNSTKSLNCKHPECENPNDILLIDTDSSMEPGNCCPTYKCAPQPNCTDSQLTILQLNQQQWLQSQCEKCKCIDGVKYCHNICYNDTTTTTHNKIDDILLDDQYGIDNIVIDLPITCFSPSKRKHYVNGEHWKEDDCTLCKCDRNESKCISSVCKALHCEKKLIREGECCPKCDLSDNKYCDGHKECEIACRNGYEIDELTGCTLCKCSVTSSTITPTTITPTTTGSYDPVDTKNFRFCNGHELCEKNCQNNYQKDETYGCLFCECLDKLSSSTISTPTTITKLISPDLYDNRTQPNDSPSRNFIYIVSFIGLAILLVLCVIIYYCVKNKRTYKMVPSDESINRLKI